jgi:iron-sulfur cluster repair protein YtfE (RIC family)
MATRRHDHAPPEDAIAMLQEDHRRVRDLFQEYEAAMDPRTKRELAEEVCTELETHAQLEEQIFYPAVQEESQEGRALVQEAIQEHQKVAQ